MVRHRALKLGLALVGLLALPVLLPAQTPTITGIQSGFGAVTPTNGPAITAGTQGPPSCFNCLNLFINGNFNTDVDTEVDWNQTFLTIQSQSSTQIVVNVPANLYAAGTAGTATITVTEFNGCETNCPTATSPFTINPAMASISLLPTGIVSLPYSQAFFTGGTGNALSGANFTVKFSPGSPPPLLSRTTDNPPLLAGTPIQSGTFPVIGTVTDSWGNQLALSDSIVILARLMITTASLPSGLINRAYTPTTAAAAGGTAPNNLTWSSSGLPTGMSIAPATGVISGTPTVSGQFSVTLSATDGSGQTAITSPPIPLTIYAILTITTNSLPTGVINHAYAPTTAAATGGTAPNNLHWTATGLPAGMSIAPATGMISGTPTASGPFSVILSVTDGSGQSASSPTPIPLTIYATITITTNSLPAGLINRAYTPTTAAATGGTAPNNLTWSASGLPAGMSISPSGVISGTPTVSGPFSVILSVTDGSGQSAQAALPLQIIGLLTISAALPAGAVNVLYAGSDSATGGVPPYTFSANGLPGGLSINSATGAVSGTPNGSGTSSVTVRVTDSGGTLAQSAQVTVPIVINAPSPPPLQIVTPSLGGGTTGQIYSTVIAAGGGTGGYSFGVISGSLPPGVQLALGGQLYGTPASPGTYSFTAQVTDSTTNTATRGFSIVIAPATLAVTGTPPTTVAVNSTLSVQFGAAGGVPPYKIAISGSTPTGTSFSNGALSGVASATGSFSFTVTATDSETPPATTSQGYAITVTSGSIVISANLPAGQVGQSYSGQFSATGGAGGYSFSGSGSNGLSVSSSGVVSGTPTAAGTASLSVTVTDSSGAKASGSFSVVINGLFVTTTSLTDGALTVAYSATLGASGGTAPYSWSATGLPNGLSVSPSSGTISGTPTQQGVFSVNVTVTDHDGKTAAATLSLNVGPAPVTITTTGITPPALGVSFSLTFGATGGTPPYTWSATGLPGGVTLDPNGTLSGTPASTGTFPITVIVTDSKGQRTTQNLNLVVTLPPAPGTSLNGFPANGTPATQVTSAVTFSATYPVDVTVTLKLTFAPASGPDDPNVQFATGGRTTTATVKAGSTTSLTTIGVQTGTVAGVITITEQLVAANGTDITPVPAPTRTITIGASAPTVTSVTVTPGTNQFTVVVVGFDPTRAITQLNFTFTPAAGSTLQTGTVTIPAQTLFNQWYQSSASVPFGSQFSFTITFTVSGNVSSIQSVTVTLTNPTGTSTGTTAPV